MATRIFEFNSFDEYGSYLRFIPESEISHEYNMYGFYKENENFSDHLADYKEERNSAFAEWKEENEGYTLADVKEFIDDFIDGYSYYFTSDSGRPERFTECHDEDYFGSPDGFFEDEDGTIPADPSPVELLEEWNGSNWVKTYLPNEQFDSFCTEVTDEYGDFENFVKFGEWRHNTGGGHFGFDPATKTYFRCDWSAYQGTTPTTSVVTPSEVLAQIDLDGYGLGDMKEELGKELQELFSYELRTGESVYFDQGSVCFEYRGEFYHFSQDELRGIPEENYYSYYSDSVDTDCLEFAREAIQKRRVERATERLAKNNYEGVKELPLNRIFVTYSDSIGAGNCVEHSQELQERVKMSEGISGDYALRADVLLSYRDDNYSRRAVLAAYRNNYCN